MREASTRITAALLAVLVALVVAACGSGDETAEADRQGQPSPAVAAAEREALAEYRQYLAREAGLLSKWTGRLEDQIAKGDQFTASFHFSTSRVHYGHLQPGARLVPRLNARVNDRFHEIESVLFGDDTTKGLDPLARRLVAEVRSLGRALGRVEISSPALAEESELLMKEVSGRMMDGKEAPHSRLDLVDVSASVEGTQEAFTVLEPLLSEQDPRLVARIEADFAEAYERLGEHGTPARMDSGPEAGRSFIVFNYFDPAELEEMSFPLDSLTRLFGQVAEQFAGS